MRDEIAGILTLYGANLTFQLRRSISNTPMTPFPGKASEFSLRRHLLPPAPMPTRARQRLENHG